MRFLKVQYIYIYLYTHINFKCEDSGSENFADHTKSYACSPDTDTLIYKLQSTSDKPNFTLMSIFYSYVPR